MPLGSLVIDGAFAYSAVVAWFLHLMVPSMSLQELFPVEVFGELPVVVQKYVGTQGPPAVY